MLRSNLDLERRETVSEFPKSLEQVDLAQKIKVKVRFDYKGLPRPARFFIGGKGSKEVAEELRQQQANVWRNVPMQGVRIDDLELMELYSVYDEMEQSTISYAPLELKVTVDTLEDCLRFVSKDEFRRMEIIEPVQLNLCGRELERLFFKFAEIQKQRLREQELK
ncbi:MAG: hypothetical protein AB1767_07325 [Bacillota bacterium]